MTMDNLNAGPHGSPESVDSQAADISLYNKYKRKIEKAESKKKIFNKWAKMGKEAFKGYNLNEESVEQDFSNVVPAGNVKQSPGVVLKMSVNYLRQPIEQQINKTYARNPKFIAKPRKPIFVDAPPVQGVDPFTGMPAMIPQIGEDGLPKQIDVSEQICDVVEIIMEDEFLKAMFKSEAKACAREAHHSPASVMQIGYQFVEETGEDSIYFRRRRFDKFLIDPRAEIYEGAVRRCGWMGFEWELTRDEAEKIGLDWNAITPAKDAKLESDDEVQTACVVNIWDKESGVVVWVPKNGKRLGKEPEPWPWKLDGFPFNILKLCEDSDQQFSKPPILEALPINEELQVQRSEITDNVVLSKPMTLYDPLALDAEKASSMSDKYSEKWVPIKGLLGMPQDPFRRIGNSSIDADYYAHFNRNKQELLEVLGTSENEALRTTKATAAEAQILDRNSGNATSAKIDAQTDFLNSCAKTAVAIIKQTYDTERVTQIIGRDNVKYWVRWVGSQILQDISIEIETGSTEREDSVYNRQVALNMLETMKGVPGIDVTMLAIDLLRENGKRNPEVYRMAPQPLMGVNNQGVSGVGPTTGVNPASSVGNQINPIA